MACRQMWRLFRNSMWIEKVAFLTDITAHLNKLNLEIQGKNVVISNMFTAVTSFENKLQLFVSHLSSEQLTHFPKLSTLPSVKQLELIDIQSNDILKRLHSTSVSALVFWQSKLSSNGSQNCTFNVWLYLLLWTNLLYYEQCEKQAAKPIDCWAHFWVDQGSSHRYWPWFWPTCQ